MAAFDWLADVRPQLAERLAPGEQLRAALRVEADSGRDEARDTARRAELRDQLTEATPPAKEPASTGGRFAQRLGGAVLDFVTNTSPFKRGAPDAPDARGTSVRGEPGSRAVWLRDVLAGDADQHVFAVSDQRILVLTDSHGAPTRHRSKQPLPYGVLAEIARADLRGARHAPVGLSRARVELEFVDGSMLAVTALNSAHAGELERALAR